MTARTPRSPTRVFGLDHLTSHDTETIRTIRSAAHELKAAIRDLGTSRELSLALSQLDMATLLVAEHVNSVKVLQR